MASGFHTRFDRYMRDYGMPWLEGTALAWMRRFHNRADATLVPTRELLEQLAQQGFQRPVRLGRAVDTRAFRPDWRGSAAFREALNATPPLERQAATAEYLDIEGFDFGF